jgi:undecaprenyl diphosphate synthase
VARVVVKPASKSQTKLKSRKVSRKKIIKPPTPHRSSIRPPKLDAKRIPNHVAIVMDGNGRWAKQRGLARTAGHEAGELALVDIVHGAIEIGVKELSVYAFSTENWRRSPEEVKFLMGFNRQVIHDRRTELNELGVKIRWVGRAKKLCSNVITELKQAEELTKNNKVLTLNMCINYGGHAEIMDAAVAFTKDAIRKKIKPDSLTEKTFAKYLYAPQMRDVDLFLRSSGEQRTSNFLMWQSAYAEMVFMDVLWPDADRRTLWRAIKIYAERERRFGKA